MIVSMILFLLTIPFLLDLLYPTYQESNIQLTPFILTRKTEEAKLVQDGVASIKYVSIGKCKLKRSFYVLFILH